MHKLAIFFRLSLFLAIFSLFFLITVPLRIDGEDDPYYVLYDEILGYKPEIGNTSMAVDKEGMLWLSSNGHVFRYNGGNWEDFTVQSGGADMVTSSSDSILWFAGNGQLIKFNGTEWIKKTDIPRDRITAFSAAPNNIVWLAFNKDENVYLLKFDEEKLLTYRERLLQNYVGRLTATQEGNVWIVYHNFFDQTDCNGENCPIGTSCFNGETFSHFSIDNGLPAFDNDSGYTDVEWIVNDSEGGGAYAWCNGYLVRYSAGEWIIIDRNFKRGVMVEGYDGRIWIGYLGQSYGSYLKCYNHGEWIIYDINTVWSDIYNKYKDDYSQQYIGTYTMVVTPDNILYMETNKGIVKININSLPYSVITSVESSVPDDVADKIQCFPNPFNSTTTLNFNLKNQGYAEIDIFSINGQKIKNLASEHLSAGSHILIWDGTDNYGNMVSSGIYLVAINNKSLSVCLITLIERIPRT